MEITKDQLIKLLGLKKEQLINNLLPYLNDTIKKYEINTNLRVCHFLSQLLHESTAFTRKVENLNYSADRLLVIFPKYFDITNALSYARNPKKIANRVYANRMGNGNEASGDGYKFRGRGYIQTTGHDNYKSVGDELKIDLMKIPELLEKDEYAILSAGFYWSKNKLNLLADKDDIVNITKRINGGINGLDDRKVWLNKCKLIFK